MLDDLRNSSFQDEEEPMEIQDEPVVQRRAVRRRSGQFMGMTSQQRFVLSLMMFFMICILGALVLVVFERIYLPFL